MSVVPPSGGPPPDDNRPRKTSWTDKAKATLSFNKAKKEKKKKQFQETDPASLGSGPPATSGTLIPKPPAGPLARSLATSATSGTSSIPKPPSPSPSPTSIPQQAPGPPAASSTSSSSGQGKPKPVTPQGRGQQSSGSPQGRGQQSSGSSQGRGQQTAGTGATTRSDALQIGGQRAPGTPPTSTSGLPPSPSRSGSPPPSPPGTPPSSSPAARTWMRNGIIAQKRLSTVFLCTNLQNNKKFIAKTVLAHELEPRTAIEIERRMYKGYKPIHSPFFIQYLGFNIEEKCVEMENHDVCNMFLEWVPRGSLSQYIRRQKEPLKESLIATFCRDILKALIYLHGQGKIHGDIKASNILVGNECLRLCDLGSGKVTSDGDVLIPPKRGRNPLERRIYTTGSDGYRAPEVEAGTEQGPPADIYAVGCTMVEMATGDPPERCPRIFRSRDETDPKTGYPVYTIDLPAEFSKAAFEFLEICLNANPRRRPSAEALLGHRWFTESVLRYPFGNPKHAPQKTKQ